MNESILITIKKLLGITEEYEHFDLDIVTHINSVFVILNQLNVGPKEGYYISANDDPKKTWADYLGSDYKSLSIIISYMHLKVKMLFDPPTIGTVTEANNNLLSEMEWRILANTDYKEE